ncbi:MAG: hypothetical protein M1136_05930 [Chloroflexi bacterium]|nr:hypothetical protein [Chloroflexota bacterium]MCL5075177.1 hypothetical protein [Chloroflexota bacterium]
MPKVFVIYELKPETDPRKYEEWSTESDQPTMRAAASVLGLTLYKVLPKAGEMEKRKYIEVIDVSSLQDFERDLQTPEVRKTSGEWLAQVNADFQIIYAEEVGQK